MTKRWNITSDYGSQCWKSDKAISLVFIRTISETTKNRLRPKFTSFEKGTKSVCLSIVCDSFRCSSQTFQLELSRKRRSQNITKERKVAELKIIISPHDKLFQKLPDFSQIWGKCKNAIASPCFHGYVVLKTKIFWNSHL